jgi:copper chaperone CopZ
MIFQPFTGTLHKTLFFCLSFLLVWMPATASTTPLQKQTIVEIKNVSCNYCLAEINGVLLNLDHTAHLRIITYPRLFSVTHHASLHDDTIISALTTAGFPAEVLGLSDISASELQAELPDAVVQNKNKMNRQPCSASAQAWKKLFRRLHHGLFPEEYSPVLHSTE